ncbi:unnamed protein product [Linum tenue]|uniref:Uncharacterized protein n=1 Tax=Linum tenue TaxID=586396 RepID=A0AAV0H5T5_9ROSI|nr:unnamed protein product [Linum tenue]
MGLWSMYSLLLQIISPEFQFQALGGETVRIRVTLEDTAPGFMSSCMLKMGRKLAWSD